jgi:phytoene desaturase
MKKDRSAIILGAGAGGLATAVYLAKNGYNVSVYEKNASPGGRCGQIVRNGYRFDLGATMLLMPGVYQQVFGELGIPLEEGKDILPLDELYTIWFDDGSSIVFTKDEKRMEEQLERIEPGSHAKSVKYVSDGYRIYQLGMEKLVGRNFYNIFQFANFRNIILLFRLKTFITNWRYARKFFSEQHLMMAYTFQNIYVGQSPFNSPALFSMVPAAELTEGSFYCQGGMYGIIRKLFDEALKQDVKFYFNTAAKKIIVEGDRADAVLLEDESEVKADLIIANADLPYVYRSLLPDRRKSARLDRMNYSCSAICFHWGVDKVYPQLKQHNVFLSDNFRAGLDRIFIDKTLGDDPSFYIHSPVKIDPSAAPSGHDSLSVVVGAGHVDPEKNQDWNMLKQKTREAVIERLKKHGMPDIEEHIKFEACYTPESWENAINISRGSVFGSLGHNMMQMGYFRPHNRHDRYRNLYFVGGSTHPGNGIPNILMSARLVSERIMKEQQAKK